MAQPTQLPAAAAACLRIRDGLIVRSIRNNQGIVGPDVMSSLIYTAIWTANISHIEQTDANFEFGDLHEIPPHEQRMPVSVRAIANSLCTPYETVRRKIAGLIKRGICVAVPGRGVLVTLESLSNPQALRVVEINVEILMWFLEELARMQYEFASTSSDELRCALGGAAMRPALRLQARYALRTLEARMQAHKGDLTTTAMFLAVVAFRHWPDIGMPLRGPTTKALSELYRIPNETARRHIKSLIESGQCVRDKDGFLSVPEAALRRIETNDVLRQDCAVMAGFVRGLVRIVKAAT